MMKQIFIFTICALVALSRADVVEPYDLAEEAEKQLQELISIVQGRILLADDDIQDLYNAFRDYSRDRTYYATRDITLQYQEVSGQITQVKNLAQSGGKDVSSCTSIREQVLQEQSTAYGDQITQCVNGVISEGQQLTRDAKYFVDIIMNKVHNIENQLKTCGGNFLCISPLVTQIQLYKVSLIQDIRNEVAEIDGLLLSLMPSSKYCADQGVSAYVAVSNVILNEIITCANAILG